MLPKSGTLWIVWQALCSPKLELVQATATRAGEDAWKIELVVQNTGWLPAYVSKRALARKTVRGLVAEIALSSGATLVAGKAREEHGQLEGRAYKHTGVSFWPDYNITDDRIKVEWVVRAKQGQQVELVARHEKAGVVRASVRLG